MWRLRLLWKDITKTRVEEELGQCYTPFRYHPVRFGECFNQRYEILGKLGWGQYSTVWLANDMHNLGQYVSLKMLSADTPSVKAERERDVLAELGDRNPGLSGRSHIIELLDSFYHSGPNGQHMCLVYKPMGEHLLRLQARVPDNKLPVPLMKRITRQLLQALDYMHSCGWVHTDIKHTNILTELDKETVLPNFLKDTQVARYYAAMYPGLTIATTPMDAPEDHRELNVRLADFGEAQRIQDVNTEEIQSVDLRAPEVILKTGWDTKVDIWNLAIIIWECFERRRLFDGRVLSSEKYSLQGHLWEMVHQLGPAPQRLRQCKLGQLFFDDSGHVRGLPTKESLMVPHFWDWEENLEGSEQEEFLHFMRSMLRWLPEERSSAKELLQHSWLKAE